MGALGARGGIPTQAHTLFFFFKMAHSTIPDLPLCAQTKPLLVQNHFDKQPFRGLSSPECLLC